VAIGDGGDVGLRVLPDLSRQGDPLDPHDERDIQGAVAAMADIRREPQSALCRMEDRAPATALSVTPESFGTGAEAQYPAFRSPQTFRSGFGMSAA